MAIGERILNTIGGSAKTGLKWGAVIAGVCLLIGVAGTVGLGIGMASFAAAAFEAGWATAAIGPVLGALACAIGAVAMGFFGISAAGSITAGAGALGVVKGGTTELLRPGSKVPELQQQFEAEMQRGDDLRREIMERQLARQENSANAAACCDMKTSANHAAKEAAKTQQGAAVGAVPPA